MTYWSFWFTAAAVLLQYKCIDYRLHMFRTRKDKGKAGKIFKGHQLNVGPSVELVVTFYVFLDLGKYEFNEFLIRFALFVKGTDSCRYLHIKIICTRKKCQYANNECLVFTVRGAIPNN